jgi:hypothetical protein
MNWTSVMIRKITAPTTKLPPTTNSPNERMTSPASACKSINRVAEISRERR